jgi:hypothetical protein
VELGRAVAGAGRGVSLEQELAAAQAAAAAHAGPGERVAAVIPAEPAGGLRVHLVAFEGGERLGYVMLDVDGTPVADERLVRDAVSLIALCELAEEVSMAAAAADIGERFEAVARLLARNEPEASSAAGRVAGAARRVGEVAAGPRVATPGYLDSLAEAADDLGAAFAAYASHAERLAQAASTGGAPEEQAREAWAALAETGRTADPGGVGQALEGSTASVEALADDVVAGYRVIF